ncbi:MAG TPA: hypothetical protein VJK29_12570 [Terriglobales bacterium]|jgi:hypothetical protein|nr:hypothetical protein [Terriglobales bacterium]
MANLTVIMRNPEPNREQRYPGTWLMHTQHGRAVKLIVTHVLQDRPQVKSRETVAA